MDYGRYRYEQTKKKQEAKKKQSSFQVKEIKVRPKTGEHDLQTKIGHIKKFIGRKDKVKVTVIFRGREITLSKLGMSLLEKIAEQTEEIGYGRAASKIRRSIPGHDSGAEINWPDKFDRSKNSSDKQHTTVSQSTNRHRPR